MAELGDTITYAIPTVERGDLEAGVIAGAGTVIELTAGGYVVLEADGSFRAVPAEAVTG